MKMFDKIAMIMFLSVSVFLMIDGTFIHPESDSFTHGMLFLILARIYETDRKIEEKNNEQEE